MLGQRERAGDILHYEIRKLNAVRRERIGFKDLRDPGMTQMREDLRLELEAAQRGLGRRSRPHHLDGHRPPGLLLPRGVHRSHAAHANDPLNVVTRDSGRLMGKRRSRPTGRTGARRRRSHVHVPAGVFDGGSRWLEIEVASPSGGTYTTLTPRQSITATPYALRTRGLAVNDAGNVGIGTDSTLSSLTVLGADDINGTAWFTSPKGVYSSHVHYGDTGDWYLRSADGAGKVVLQDTGGDVGIGTSAPYAKLDVVGDVRINDADLHLRGGTDTFHGLGWHGFGKPFASVELDGPMLYGFNGGAGGTRQGDVENLALAWRGNGNVGIGTFDPTAKLHVAGTPGVDGVMFPDGTL